MNSAVEKSDSAPDLRSQRRLASVPWSTLIEDPNFAEKQGCTIRKQIRERQKFDQLIKMDEHGNPIVNTSNGENSTINTANRTGQVPPTSKEDETKAIMEAIISATKKAEREVKRNQIVSVKDLPTFGCQGHEDANDFMGQFESCAQVYEWDELLKIKDIKILSYP